MTAISNRRHETKPGHSGAAEPAAIDELHHRLGAAARRRASAMDVLDVEAAVNAAAAVCADDRALADPLTTAVNIGDAAASMLELALPDVARAAVDWSGFGVLIPVLSGSPGAGASVLAAAIAGALQRAGRCVLLVDAAEPSRSGLAAATSTEGPWLTQPHQQLAIRHSWRGHTLVARLESGLPTITPGMVPPPPAWLPEVDPLHVTVADIGHDGWRATANPLVGAGGWLRRPARRPLVPRSR